MKTIFIFIICVLSCLYLDAQNLKYGAGISYDMGINFDETSKYKISLPEHGKTTSIGCMDIFIKVQLKNGINIYPTIIFTVFKGLISLENTEGDFMPEGYTVKLPYSTVGNGWNVYHYSDDYNYFLSDGDMSQTSIGSFITKNILNDFEVGTGIFFKFKKTEIKNYKAYDKYMWSSSTGTQFDNYDYSETIVSSEPYQKENLKVRQISMPILLQYYWNNGNFFTNTSFITYIGKDLYFSLRMTMGFGISKKEG